MKRVALFLMLAVVVFSQQSCKQDPPLNPPTDNEPDSLFAGTPFALQRPNLFFRQIPQTPNNPMTLEGIRLGRMLFWDPIVSSDSSLSCAGCHKPEMAFTDGLQFSQNLSGLTKRNTPSIQNSVWMPQIFWDGRQPSLEKATEDALIDEQHFIAAVAIERLERKPEYVALFKKAFGRPGNITAEKIFKAMAQFMRTAISSNSKFDLWRNGLYSFSASEQRGFEIFSSEKGDCFHCHTDGPFLTFTNNQFLNNGLQEANSINDFKDKGLGAITGSADDYGKFKSPTLRNLSHTAPYMHDGRFQTLEQVINFYSDSLKRSPTISPLMKQIDNGGLHLDAQEKADLLAFLLTLDDEKFVSDSAFTNPFK